MKNTNSEDNSITIYRKVTELYFKEYIKELKINRGERILDFGCGRGSFSEILLRTLNGSYALYLYDKDKSRQAEIDDKFINQREVYIIKNLADLSSIADGSIDRVILHFVLHEMNLVETEQLFMIFHRLMKQGGSINIRDPLGSKEGLDIQEIDRIICGSGFAINDIQTFDMPFQGRAVSIYAIAS